VKKITASILTVMLTLSMVFSSSVFAAEKTSAWDSFVGLFSNDTATTEAASVGVQYKGHVQNKGDVDWVTGPETLGTEGESLRLEAFYIELTDAPADMHIMYRVQVQNKGWMDWAEDGAIAGTTGEGLQVETVEIKLVDDNGDAYPGYSVEYQGHVQNKGDMPADESWYVDGEQLGTVGEFLRLEALRVQIVKDAADMTAYNAAVEAAEALTEADYTADSWAALQTALTDNVVTEDNTQEEVDAATAAINAAIDALVMVTRISDAVATANDTFTVTLNQAAASTDTLTVKKGSVAVNLDTVTFADDMKSAVIETTTKFTEGTYTITLTTADGTSTKDVTVDNEKVGSIVITNETAPMNPVSAVLAGPTTYVAKATVFADYKVLNQYGEEMTGQTINWSASTGGKIGDNTTTQKLTIGNYDKDTVFIPGAALYITGVHASTGTVVNASVTVGLEAKEDSVAFKGVYDTTAGALIDTLPAGFVDDRYVLLYEVYDQYDNLISDPTTTNLTFISNYPVFVAAPVAASATDVEIDDVTYEAVKIVRGIYADKGGTSTIQAISNLTGTTSSYDLSSTAKAAVKTFTMSAPTSLIAETETVEIPFTAVDQFGNAVVKYDDLNGKVTFSPSGQLKLVKKADGTAKLEYTAPDDVATEDVDYTAYLTSLVTDGGNFSSLMITVKEKMIPTTVVGLDSDVLTSISKGGAQVIEADDVIVQDQYGRTLTDEQLNTWINADANNGLVLESVYSASSDTSPFTVVATGQSSDAEKHYIVADTSTFTVTGKTASGLSATEKMVFSLTTNGGTSAVTTSSKSVTFTLTAQSEFASYEVTDLGTMYNDGLTTSADPYITNYAKTVEAFGIKANGTKVAIPADLITVTLDTDDLTTNGHAVIKDLTSGGYDASANDFKNYDGSAKNINVVATIHIADRTTGVEAAEIEKALVVSNDAPVVTTVELDADLVDEGAAFVEAQTGGYFVADNLTSVIDTTEDQYGVDKSETPTIVISGLTQVDGSEFAVTGNNSTSVSVNGAAEGDKFTATFKYVGGKTVSVNFTVADQVSVSSISVKTAPTKTAYNTGETLDLAGMEITVTYSDSTTEDIAYANFVARGITTSPEQGDTITASGDVTVTCDSKTTTQAITFS
jgi:uncharacterized protein YjdB